MAAGCRRDAGGRALARLPDTTARLVCFTILTRTRRGRTKTAQVRVLTTLLDPVAFPAREIAACYAARWQVETAFLRPSAEPAGPCADDPPSWPGRRPGPCSSSTT
jgi:hypothetical protein